MAKGLLKSGAKPARGGKRAGAGRPPDWLKKKCSSLVDKNKLLEFVMRVAVGEETEQHVTKEGDVVDVAPSTHDRLRAVEMLLDRGFGKPAQAVELGGADGQPLTVNLITYGGKA